VRWRVAGPTTPIGSCHCSLCRKASGADGNAVMWAGTEGFAWEAGEEAVRVWERAPGAWANAFCSVCGSQLPVVAEGLGRVFVPAGGLDDDPGHRGIAVHIYAAHRAPWVVLDGGAPHHDDGFPERTA
jgi:hypothetical protein